MTSASVHPVVILDACCLLNLYATRHIEDILTRSPVAFAASDRTLAETLYVYRGGGGEDAKERESVDLDSLTSANLLQVLSLDTEAEYATFVVLTMELDDGEAEALALAIHRHLAVATDDRKTLKLLGHRYPHLKTFTTPSLLKQWAEHCSIDPARLRYVLRDVQERGNYLPRNDDALRAWWQGAAKDT